MTQYKLKPKLDGRGWGLGGKAMSQALPCERVVRGRPETGSREAERVETSPAGAPESSHRRMETKAEGRFAGAE